MSFNITTGVDALKCLITIKFSYNELLGIEKNVLYNRGSLYPDRFVWLMVIFDCYFDRYNRVFAITKFSCV